MTSEGKKFPIEKEGYDVVLVDFYIDTMAEAYRLACEEHSALRARFSDLREEYVRLEEKTRLDPDIKSVTKMIVEMESITGRLMVEAAREAENMRKTAMSIIDDAYSKAAAIEESARASGISAMSELQRAKNDTQRIIDDANARAADIVENSKKTLDEAWSLIRETSERVDELLSSRKTRSNAAGAVRAGRSEMSVA